MSFCTFGLRRCQDCKVVKPLSSLEFSRNKTKKFGLEYQCRTCHQARTRRYHAKHNNKISARRPHKSRFQLFLKFNFTCQYCGRKAPNVQLQIDHVIPRSKGGLDVEENYVVACWDCNIGKSDVLLPQ